MLSLERCNRILQKHNVSLPLEEVQKIKDFLEIIAAVQIKEENNKRIKDVKND